MYWGRRGGGSRMECERNGKVRGQEEQTIMGEKRR